VQTFANVTGESTGDISIRFAPGSVKVSVDIAVSGKDADPNMIKSTIDRTPNLATAIGEKVDSIPDLPTTGGRLTISSITTKVHAPSPQPAPSPSPPIVRSHGDSSQGYQRYVNVLTLGFVGFIVAILALFAARKMIRMRQAPSDTTPLTTALLSPRATAEPKHQPTKGHQQQPTKAQPTTRQENTQLYSAPAAASARSAQPTEVQPPKNRPPTTAHQESAQSAEVQPTPTTHQGHTQLYSAPAAASARSAQPTEVQPTRIQPPATTHQESAQPAKVQPTPATHQEHAQLNSAGVGQAAASMTIVDTTPSQSVQEETEKTRTSRLKTAQASSVTGAPERQSQGGTVPAAALAANSGKWLLPDARSPAVSGMHTKQYSALEPELALKRTLDNLSVGAEQNYRLQSSASTPVITPVAPTNNSMHHPNRAGSMQGGGSMQMPKSAVNGVRAGSMQMPISGNGVRGGPINGVGMQTRAHVEKFLPLQGRNACN